MHFLLVIAIIIVGFITGTVTSLIGASGVCVVVPVLTLFFGINSHLAIGTSLMVDVITSIVVAIGYFKHGNVRLKASLWITVGSVLGAQLGSHWAGMIHDGPLSLMFAVVLIISGIATLKKGVNRHFDSQRGVHFKNNFTQTLALLVIGGVIGIISGLVGAGGGVMILLAIIFILHYPVHQAVGTSTVIMAITALSSMLGYARQGNVDWVMGALIASGAVVAGIVGARYANSINEEKLNKVISWVFILLGFLMIGIRLVH